MLNIESRFAKEHVLGHLTGEGCHEVKMVNDDYAGRDKKSSVHNCI